MPSVKSAVQRKLEKPMIRLRHVVSRLNHKKIPLRLAPVLKHANNLLKHEEIHGGAWYNWLLNPIGSTIGALFGDSAERGYNDVAALPTQVIQEVPAVGETLKYFFPDAALAVALAPLGKYMYGDNTNQWLTRGLGDSNQDTGYTVDPETGLGLSVGEIPDYLSWVKKRGQPPSGQDFIDALSDKLEQENVHIEDLSGFDAYAPYSVTGVDTLVYDANGNILQTPQALRFPSVMPDSREKAKSVREFLLTTERRAEKVMHRETESVIDAQAPYAWLNFPMYNSGNQPIAYKNVPKSHYKRIGAS